MKAFNLEEALAGKPVVTRDGREVTDLHFFKNATKNSMYPVYGVIEGEIYTWTKEGSLVEDREFDEHDLFMQVETKSFWVNYYDNGNVYAHPSKGKADSMAGSDRLLCKEVTFTI